MIKAYIPVELELTRETVIVDKGWLGYPTVDICKGLITCCDPKNGETQKVPIFLRSDQAYNFHVMSKSIDWDLLGEEMKEVKND